MDSTGVDSTKKQIRWRLKVQHINFFIMIFEHFALKYLSTNSVGLSMYNDAKQTASRYAPTRTKAEQIGISVRVFIFNQHVDVQSCVLVCAEPFLSYL